MENKSYDQRKAEAMKACSQKLKVWQVARGIISNHPNSSYLTIFPTVDSPREPVMLASYFSIPGRFLSRELFQLTISSEFDEYNSIFTESLLITEAGLRGLGDTLYRLDVKYYMKSPLGRRKKNTLVEAFTGSDEQGIGKNNLEDFDIMLVSKFIQDKAGNFFDFEDSWAESDENITPTDILEILQNPNLQFEAPKDKHYKTVNEIRDTISSDESQILRIPEVTALLDDIPYKA